MNTSPSPQDKILKAISASLPPLESASPRNQRFLKSLAEGLRTGKLLDEDWRAEQRELLARLEAEEDREQFRPYWLALGLVIVMSLIALGIFGATI